MAAISLPHRHKKIIEDAPSRVELHEPITFGERIADRAASGIGSWRFIIVQTILVIIWVIVNLTGFILQWDPYPFILLNLMFSVQAAYTGPILLLASNRQAAKDRAMAQRDDEELGVIYKLQHEQMEVLRLLQDAQDKHTELLEMMRKHIGAGASA
ncbi:MAG TPA: DUF1003 domain-containing protein [Chloroflexota bacterium]|nr:DUF1003 domain-containing protein [Chloroflexota bacterium]